jgi:streptogramin lyase
MSVRSLRVLGVIVSAALSLGLAACSQTGAAGALPDAASRSAPRGAAVRRSAEGIRIQELKDLPRGYYNLYFPSALAVRGYALWIADDIDQDAGQSAVVRVAPSGKRTKTYLYQNDASPSFEGIVAGPDGALWLTDWGDDQILRVATNGAITAYPLRAYGNGAPQGIAVGPDGAMWFANNASNGQIGRITTGGAVTTYSTGISPGAAIQGITLGPDGALWFCESFGDRIGRITTHGKVTEFSSGITTGSQPYSIVAGPDGALWFTELTDGRIGRITTKGKVTLYSQGITPGEHPNDIAAGLDGSLWFTESEEPSSSTYLNAKIGRITMRGKITEYPVPTSDADPTGIVQGPDGNIWFVETGANRLGRVDL